MPNTTHVSLNGRLVIVGFGSIGQGVLPLILRHVAIAPERITIVTAEPRGKKVALEYGVNFIETPLTRENYRSMLDPLISAGDFLLNVSVDVASVALIELCQEKGVLYLDTCVEPWPGGYTDPNLSPSARSNYALREGALALRQRYPSGPTAVLTHGANPGLVSHFVKQGLVDLARAGDPAAATPSDRAGWGGLAERLGIKVIHIAERDTQVASVPKSPGEFVNTWSIDGFFSEGSQPAELGWGTHERHFPADGHRHDFGSGAAIYLLRPGAGTRVRSWTPLEGPYTGFLVTHNESQELAAAGQEAVDDGRDHRRHR
jgi:homospermidine synthase